MYKVYGKLIRDEDVYVLGIFDTRKEAVSFARACVADGFVLVSVEACAETLTPTTKTIHKALW